MIEQQLIEERARELARQMSQESKELNTLLSSGRVFTRFDYGTDVIENQKEIVTTALFSDGTTSMGSFFTGSYQSVNQKQYYYDIVKNVNSLESEFSLTYGHIDGSGSSIVTPFTYPTKAIYRQYKQILLDSGQDVFTFKNGVTSNHIYVLNVKRERFKQRFDPGNWQLTLRQLNGNEHGNQFYTGSNVDVSGSKIITLIDDSGDSAQEVSSLTDSGRVYNIVSGSISNGVFTSNTSSYGSFYPDYGVVILNPNVLNSELQFNTVTGSGVQGNNSLQLLKSISGSVAIINTGSFEGRSSEVITSAYYYCRIKNTEYNFSNNPSFATGSLGDIRHSVMLQDPKVYITTIGLYNDRQELLAVGKLSKPILKTFSTEGNVKVKIDW